MRDAAAAARIRAARDLGWRQAIAVGDHTTPGPTGAEDAVIAEFLQRQSGAIAGARVLQPGCGDGLWTCWLAGLGAGHVDATDAEEREQFRLVARALGLPAAYHPGLLPTALAAGLKRRYDLVCSLGLLSRLDDPLIALIMYRGYLRPGGVLILATAAADAAEPYLMYLGPRAAGDRRLLPARGFLRSAVEQLGMTVEDEDFRAGGGSDALGRPLGDAVLRARQTGAAELHLYPHVLDQLGMTGEPFAEGSGGG